MPIIKVATSKHSQMIDITSQINALIPVGMANGICCIFSRHTTAGITINENADPAVCSDILNFLDQSVPWNEPLFSHMEGNSAAHIKSSMMGFSQMVPVDNGQLSLGVWQGVYFCEFDGPRKRSVHISLLKS